MKKINYKSLLIQCLLFVFLSVGCSSNSTGSSINQKKTSYLYSAILYKESKCKNENKCKEGECRPTNISLEMLLVSAKKASSFALDACTFAIIKQECPFDSYSLVCLEIFGDIKGLGP